LEVSCPHIPTFDLPLSIGLTGLVLLSIAVFALWNGGGTKAAIEVTVGSMVLKADESTTLSMAFMMHGDVARSQKREAWAGRVPLKPSCFWSGSNPGSPEVKLPLPLLSWKKSALMDRGA